MHIPIFLIVGLLGTFTNLVLFYILVDRCEFAALPISTFTFFISSIQNYYFNHFCDNFLPENSKIIYYEDFAEDNRVLFDILNFSTNTIRIKKT